MVFHLFANSIAKEVFPLAVGPSITISCFFASILIGTRKTRYILIILPDTSKTTAQIDS
jgi:hypothetical protein